MTAPSTGDGATGAGCGDVWGSPSVDPSRGLVIFGTGNCTDPDRWGRFSDAMVAVDLATGALRWTFQPHGSNRDDLDFAGAPNLMTVDGRALAGLGNKDGTYYIVDRTTGAHGERGARHRARPAPSRRQLLHRRVHRTLGVSRRHRRRWNGRRPGPVPARHPGADRRHPLAEPGAERDVRRERDRPRHRDHRWNGLHAPGRQRSRPAASCGRTR